MGIENNKKDVLERNQNTNLEQQENDPMVGLEQASTEFGANTEKLDGLLKSEGGIDGLAPEEQGKFSALKEKLLSKLDDLKKVLLVGGLALGGAALAASGLVGLDELRQAMMIDKELVAIGLANVIAITTLVKFASH